MLSIQDQPFAIGNRYDLKSSIYLKYKANLIFHPLWALAHNLSIIPIKILATHALDLKPIPDPSTCLYNSFSLTKANYYLFYGTFQTFFQPSTASIKTLIVGYGPEIETEVQ